MQITALSMKVYIGTNNMQVELIRFRNFLGLYSRLLFRSDGPMEYRLPDISNTNHFGSVSDSTGLYRPNRNQLYIYINIYIYIYILLKCREFWTLPHSGIFG